ncbi:hypothetical protein GDO81_027311 [Engystomops pustulosus]|uniref:Taste receptor type 2 n=1 Tax=Engystomops pustulosus TaxID=76066 RepID=A0AAV6ZKH3_ENGPU|nr:hypothetical protein GDO81_027311 [Engystomops pustulosus]
MYFINPLIVVGIHISFLVTGILGNLFILIVNFHNWLKTQDFNPSMLIINSIAIIDIFLQGAIVFHVVTNFLFLEFYIQAWVVKPLVAILISLTFSSLWCSTCLCFYYCIKIVNIGGSFYYKLKARFPVFVPWILITSIATSWLVGLPIYWDLYMDIRPLTDLTAANVTLIFTATIKSRCECIFQTYNLLAGVTLAAILVTAGAIVISLCKHMIRMKKNSEGSGNSRLRSHLSATKTVTSLLLQYLIFYGFLSSIFIELDNPGGFIFLFSFIVVSTFPTLNSMILITGNRKLSNSLKKLLGVRAHTANTEVTVTTY